VKLLPVLGRGPPGIEMVVVVRLPVGWSAGSAATGDVYASADKGVPIERTFTEMHGREQDAHWEGSCHRYGESGPQADCEVQHH
jgi:hypothetical protein